MEHPVALDDHLGILEHQVAGSECPELRLPPAEDDRHDVDRHVVDEPSDSACPPTSPAPTPISPRQPTPVLARFPPPPRWRMVRRLRVPARRPRSVRHDNDVVARRRVVPQPLVRSNWCRPMTRTFRCDHMPRT
jgi:hypothetical protein